MKKFIDLDGNGKIPGMKKLFRIMKLSCFLVLVSVISVLGSKTYSQTKLLNLNMDNATVKEVLAEIEKQSEFRFMYSGKFIDVSREVSVNVKNQKIETVLDMLFAKTDVGYRIKDRFIVLTTPELMDYGVEAVFQQLTVSGKVTDSHGQPLPGVTIVIKGTTQGTTTNVDGEYTLINISPDATLVFSFVGMKTIEVPVEGKSNISIIMEEEIISIEEVVAIGYGTINKKDLTGSVASVNSDVISESGQVQLTNTLQGMSPGLMITRNTGTPGSSGSIRVRGITTIGNSSPLVIIDGIPGSIADVHPNDVENITVLKDAASASIYGSRAASGVI